ncbi:MFS transporter [Actinoplanes sp. CA-030573]|uniref:MFS transporter n=1 Tax=Actinoplanes sp. CA-030573 TaxID=3239898 RepID=UPI003D8CFC6E
MSVGTGTSTPRWVSRLVILWGVQLVDVLVVTSVIPAIPAMLAATGAPRGAATLLSASAAMAFAGLLLLSARLGDRFGHRRILVAGLVVFGLAAVTGGTAHSVGQLVVARIGQGVAAALCVPAAMWALLRLSPEPGRRRTALAGWSAAGAAAGVLGYVVGGGLTELLGWSWVFWINVPITGLLIAGVVLLVPADTADDGVRLDVWGAVLLTTSVMALVGAAAVLQDGAAGWGVAGLLAGAVLGVLFAVQQGRAAEPLVARSSRRDPHLRAGVGASFVNTATTSGIAIVVVLILQDDLGLSPAVAAVVMMPFSVAVVIGSLASRLPALATGSVRPTVLGLLAISAGGLILAIRHDQVAAIVTAIAVAGVGLGLASVGATSLGTTKVESGRSTAGRGGRSGVEGSGPPGADSAAVGLLNTAAQLGNALGVAALLALLALPRGGASAAFLLAAAAGLGTALAVRRSSARFATH